jgi:tetratricopeptide (TPR) repeat protein
MRRALRIWAGLWLAAAGLAAASPAAAESGEVAAIRRELSAAAARDGASSPRLLPLLDRLAAAEFRDGDLAAALASRRRALKLAVAAFGTEAPATAEATAALALLQIERQRYLDAEGLLIVARRRLGDTTPASIPVLSGLARIALARGDPARARPLAERAVALMTAQREPRSAEPLRVLGAVDAAERRFDDGVAVLNRALAFDRARRDPLELARSLAALGGVYLRADRFAEALPPLEEAAALDQETLGPNHPAIADDFHDLAIACEGLKRAGEARRLLAAAIALLERGDGRNSPRLAFAELELSRLQRETGDGEAADASFARARRILNAAEDEERERERRL